MLLAYKNENQRMIIAVFIPKSLKNPFSRKTSLLIFTISSRIRHWAGNRYWYAIKPEYQ